MLNAENLARELDVKQIYLKNETLNPSGSYKDRFATLAVSLAKSERKAALALGSAGNAAAAISAYSAKAEIPCYVLLPTDAVRERAWQIMTYGAHLIGIEGTIAECIQYVQEGVEQLGWLNVSTTMKFHPYATEGYKTIAYEIGRQMDFSVPDWIVCPVGGASLISKIYKGFCEMKDLGLINRTPKFAGVQAKGCEPLTKAYIEDAKETQLWQNPDTIAFAIADTCTFEGVTALNLIRETGGTSISVNDNEILDALKLLASKEAVIAEPASSVTIAALKKLRDSSIMHSDESVICILSGSGLKDLSMISKILPPYTIISRNNLCIDSIAQAANSY